MYNSRRRKKNTLKCIKSDSGLFKLVSVESHPLNQILYGPPGTGKTHNAITHALAAIKGINVKSLVDAELADPDNRKKHKAEFDQFVAEGRIQFVTFHQSYSYEEFVEGLRAKVNDKGEVYYEIESGVFKKLCEIAGKKSKEGNLEEKLIEFFDEILENNNSLGLKTLSHKNPFNVSVNGTESLKIVPDTDKATPLLLPVKHIKNYITDPAADIPYYPSYVKAIGDYIKTKFTPDLKEIDNTTKPYVLIIDEINRGNISKIFGELITLIEDTKRKGSAEELKLKLTYSGSDPDEPLFSVPSNLYIIGTMNTADKSIALVDMALRRRFTFIHYPPVSNLLTSNSFDGINLSELLDMINKRVEFLLDKDHLIGHAYFFGVKNLQDLARVFRNKIIPLLSEYFYGDLKKVGLVLGESADTRKRKGFSFITPVFDKSSDKIQKELFGTVLDEYDGKAEDMFFINSILTEERYYDLKPEYFIQIYSDEQSKPVVNQVSLVQQQSKSEVDAAEAEDGQSQTTV